MPPFLLGFEQGSGSSSDAEAEAVEEAAREELAREREKNKAKAKGGKEAGGMGAGTALGPGSPSVLVSMCMVLTKWHVLCSTALHYAWHDGEARVSLDLHGRLWRFLTVNLTYLTTNDKKTCAYLHAHK